MNNFALFVKHTLSSDSDERIYCFVEKSLKDMKHFVDPKQSQISASGQQVIFITSVSLCCYESQRTVRSEQRLTSHTLTAGCNEHTGPQIIMRALNLYLFDDDGTHFSKYDLERDTAVFSRGHSGSQTKLSKFAVSALYRFMG